MAKWYVSILTDGNWTPVDGQVFNTKREANAHAKQVQESNRMKQVWVTPVNSTVRETYSRIIGYNFGTDEKGNDQIYNGSYLDTDTGKKQYEFLYFDRSGNCVGQYLTDYKGFREIIDCYDWPKK